MCKLLTPLASLETSESSLVICYADDTQQKRFCIYIAINIIGVS
jgi:hypothetical protein